MVNKGLNMVIVIYGVDRTTQSYYFRRVVYIPNDTLLKNDESIFKVTATPDGLSQIEIKNINKLKIWELKDFDKHKLSSDNKKYDDFTFAIVGY